MAERARQVIVSRSEKRGGFWTVTRRYLARPYVTRRERYFSLAGVMTAFRKTPDDAPVRLRFKP